MQQKNAADRNQPTSSHLKEIKSSDALISELRELFEFVKNDTANGFKEVNLGKFHNYRAQEIPATSGVVVRNAEKKVTSHGIRHALRGHEDHKSENKRGQIGLTSLDFERIPEILNNPDKYEKGNKKNTVAFIKKMKGCVYYVVMGTVKNKEGGHDLVLHTMFKKSAKND